MHQELSRECEEDCIVRHEDEVFLSLAILCDIANVCWQGIRALDE